MAFSAQRHLHAEFGLESATPMQQGLKHCNVRGAGDSSPAAIGAVRFAPAEPKTPSVMPGMRPSHSGEPSRSATAAQQQKSPALRGFSVGVKPEI
jgi:hypothetical protein